MNAPLETFGGVATHWEERLAQVVAAMREMSQHTDPQAMRRAYAERMRRLIPIDNSLSLSRRGLTAPEYRITRSTRWQEDINPWTEKERLPLLSGGLLGELLYGEHPRVFDNLHVAASDPAFEYLEGHRSLVAIPLYDGGVALNMVLLLRHGPAGFRREQFPELVWMSNLFGQATHNLVLSQQVQSAFQAVDHEMQIVADIQRSLLPARMPDIPHLSVAADYQTSHRAGGDYYDIFALPDGKWGLLIADVSGHGTPAAVIMAITHSLAHTYPGSHMPPGQLLQHINRHLTTLYTTHSDTFVTAFYAVYNPADRSLVYSSAGHNPPRLKRCSDGSLDLLDGDSGLPLGISVFESYPERRYQLVPGDQLVLYTDGVVEAFNSQREMFGLERLDKVLENCAIGAAGLLESVLAALDEFTAGCPPHDDRTIVVAKVS
jgi:sigma-B regulation protein RsbU (phosphoserine phosphatase)